MQLQESRKFTTVSLVKINECLHPMHASRKRRGTGTAGCWMGESYHKSDRKAHPRDERGSSRVVDSFRKERERPDGSER